MPTYYSGGVSAHLGAAPLLRTTVVSNDTVKSVRELETDRIYQELTTATLLAEAPIYENDHFFRFIGPRQDLPFLLVHAKRRKEEDMSIVSGLADDTNRDLRGEDVMSINLTRNLMTTFDQDKGLGPMQTSHSHAHPAFVDPGADVTGLTRPAKPSGPTRGDLEWTPTVTQPRVVADALVLSVDVETRSFKDSMDIKIEVFYNGEFADCRRLHNAMERPWILLRRDAAQPDGTVPASGQQIRQTRGRWATVGHALVKEAASRGVNKHGEPSPVSQYLHSVASLSLPETVGKAQLVPAMGIIDVVVSLGHGKKYDTAHGYLYQPARMHNSQFSTEFVTKSSHQVFSDDASDEVPKYPAPKKQKLSHEDEGAMRTGVSPVETAKRERAPPNGLLMSRIKKSA
ncbi:hypothetical protein MBLNU459_g2274t2 [Dothideomycetes sp. NU459]